MRGPSVETVANNANNNTLPLFFYPHYIGTIMPIVAPKLVSDDVANSQ
jgi:hypothetical protein